MSKQPTVSLRSFRQKVRTEKTGMRRYLSKVEKNAPRYLDRTIAVLEKEVWQQTDCLDCANCCKTMTPPTLIKI
ncbi:MAG: hypothetical protein IPH18_03850 [Chitinophagaceae bacterium]|nr:hypothetical protein [Chitinophagaceae bacterium]